MLNYELTSSLLRQIFLYLRNTSLCQFYHIFVIIMNRIILTALTIYTTLLFHDIFC